MNKITKIAMGTGIVGLLILLLIISSGISHPNPLFNYGGGLGVLLILVTAILFLAGLVFNFKDLAKKRHRFATILLIVLIISTILISFIFR